MQTLSPTPTRDVSLEEALTCFCGCPLHRHIMVLKHFGGNDVRNDVRPVLRCIDCGGLCLQEDIAERVQAALLERRAARKQDTYHKHREQGWCSYCAHSNHDDCPTWVHDRNAPTIAYVCRCPRHDGWKEAQVRRRVGEGYSWRCAKYDHGNCAGTRGCVCVCHGRNHDLP